MPVVKEARTSLERIRKEQGLTQKELAYLSNVSIDTIKSYEGKRRDINLIALKNAVALADVLHCDVRDLMNTDKGEA